MQGLKSGILDNFCGFLKLLRLQFFRLERLPHRDPPPYGTFAVCLVIKIHFSVTEVPKFSPNWVKKSREIGNFFELLSRSNPRPEKPLVFFTKNQSAAIGGSTLGICSTGFPRFLHFLEDFFKSPPPGCDRPLFCVSNNWRLFVQLFGSLGVSTWEVFVWILSKKWLFLYHETAILPWEHALQQGRDPHGGIAGFPL